MSTYGYQEKALEALDYLRRDVDDLRAEVESNHQTESGESCLRLSSIQRIVTAAQIVAQRLLDYKETPW